VVACFVEGAAAGCEQRRGTISEGGVDGCDGVGGGVSGEEGGVGVVVVPEQQPARRGGEGRVVGAIALVALHTRDAVEAVQRRLAAGAEERPVVGWGQP
jgi:hypothetical protein